MHGVDEVKIRAKLAIRLMAPRVGGPFTPLVSSIQGTG